jgi:hypothetical protein
MTHAENTNISLIYKCEMLTALAMSVSILEKIPLAKNCKIICCKFWVGMQRKKLRNLFKAFICHYLITIKGRGSISWGRSLESGRVFNYGLSKRRWGSPSRLLLKYVGASSVAAQTPDRIDPTIGIIWGSIIHWLVPISCDRVGRAETEE